MRADYHTPYVWKAKDGEQLVTAGSGKCRGYDLDGKLLWELGKLSPITVSAPVAKDGIVLVGSGYFSGGPLFAVKEGARGDLTGKKAKADFIAWENDKAAAYHTTPLLVGDRVYVILDQALASCYDLKTGKAHYERQRINGVGEFCSSPIHYDGKVFCVSERGATVVIKEGTKYERLGVNELKKSCLATPAVAQNRLFIRTLTKLYCIKKS